MSLRSLGSHPDSALGGRLTILAPPQIIFDFGSVETNFEILSFLLRLESLVLLLPVELSLFVLAIDLAKFVRDF